MLSPIGLNLRAQPDKAAAVVGRAAQGTVLTVLGQTAASGGWFQVKGSTVTGWISADPTLSAPGEFRSYTGSAQFAALYPATWTATLEPPATVVFRPFSGPDSISVVAAAAVAQLPQGGDGYGQSASTQVVVCGVTSHLLTYQRAAPAPTSTSATSAPPPSPYLAQVRLTLDPQHALGLYANLTDLGAPLQVFRTFLASVSFPSPQCVG